MILNNFSMFLIASELDHEFPGFVPNIKHFCSIFHYKV